MMRTKLPFIIALLAAYSLSSNPAYSDSRALEAQTIDQSSVGFCDSYLESLSYTSVWYETEAEASFDCSSGIDLEIDSFTDQVEAMDGVVSTVVNYPEECNEYDLGTVTYFDCTCSADLDYEICYKSGEQIRNELEAPYEIVIEEYLKRQTEKFLTRFPNHPVAIPLEDSNVEEQERTLNVAPLDQAPHATFFELRSINVELKQVVFPEVDKFPIEYIYKTDVSDNCTSQQQDYTFSLGFSESIGDKTTLSQRLTTTITNNRRITDQIRVGVNIKKVFTIGASRTSSRSTTVSRQISTSDTQSYDFRRQEDFSHRQTVKVAAGKKITGEFTWTRNHYDIPIEIELRVTGTAKVGMRYPWGDKVWPYFSLSHLQWHLGYLKIHGRLEYTSVLRDVKSRFVESDCVPTD